ncbi:MAG TPA: amidohydrolase family protein [Candidatus Saccharimonadia bacterium]|nr:amidohydrolase family protein [Candidatus Saccharimonadia bacterium]
MTTSSPLIRLPGLIDIHVHLRDPGQTHKEDFGSGTAAALAGGFTRVFDMPNNATPVTTAAVLDEKMASARGKIVCDTGFYFGSLGDNLDEFPAIMDRVSGLKLYLNVTTGGYRIDADYLERIFKAWGHAKPILLHAEADVIVTALGVAKALDQRVHVCHVSNRAELEPILRAKAEGVDVTCGVTPHHLFLNEADARRLGNYGEVRPALKPQADVDYLWEHFDEIDVVESDHAPHTKAEKEAGTFGFPGLETTLPLMLAAERDGRLTRAQLVAKLADGPRRVLGLAEEADTFVEVEPVGFEMSAEGMQSRAAWTPFAGRTGFGRVKRVTLRGAVVYEDGVVLAAPGSGRLV